MFPNIQKEKEKLEDKKLSNTSKVDASGAISLSWKHHNSTPSFFMNSKLALTAHPKYKLMSFYIDRPYLPNEIEVVDSSLTPPLCHSH